MARQLVEAGVNLVQVNLGNNEARDTHQAGFPCLKNYLLPPTDRALLALDDLHDRGMLDDTLVVMASEFAGPQKYLRYQKLLRGETIGGRSNSTLAEGVNGEQLLDR